MTPNELSAILKQHQHSQALCVCISDGDFTDERKDTHRKVMDRSQETLARTIDRWWQLTIGNLRYLQENPNQITVLLGMYNIGSAYRVVGAMGIDTKGWGDFKRLRHDSINDRYRIPLIDPLSLNFLNLQGQVVLFSEPLFLQSARDNIRVFYEDGTIGTVPEFQRRHFPK